MEFPGIELAKPLWCDSRQIYLLKFYRVKELLTTKINCSQILFDFLISCLIQRIFGSSTWRSLFYIWIYIIGISWCLCYNRKALGAENRIMWANTVLANTLMSGLDMHKGFGASFRWIILSVSVLISIYHKNDHECWSNSLAHSKLVLKN